MYEVVSVNVSITAFDVLNKGFEIGADGFAPDAGSAPRLAKALLGVA